MPKPEERIIRDPHHDGISEWKFDNGSFFHRTNGGKWIKVRKIHPTQKRIAALASISCPCEATT